MNKVLCFMKRYDFTPHWKYTALSMAASAMSAIEEDIFVLKTASLTKPKGN